MFLRRLLPAAALLLAATPAGRAQFTSTPLFYSDSTPAPMWPTAGAIFTGFSAPAANATGQVAFIGGVTLPGFGVPPDDGGLFFGPPGSVSLIAYTGVQAAGLPAGVKYDFKTTIPSYSVGAGGAIAFNVPLTGDGVNPSNNLGLFRHSGGTILSVARTGNAAPGTPAGVTFAALEQPHINTAGRTLIRGTLTGASITAGVNDIGYWSHISAGGTALVVRAGDAAPGFAGYTLATVDEVRQSASIAYAFRANLVGTPTLDQFNDTAIWHGTPGSFSVLVKEGTQRPAPRPVRTSSRCEPSPRS